MIEKKAYRIHLGRLSHYPDLEVVFGEIMAENAIERASVGYDTSSMKSWVEFVPTERKNGIYSALENPDLVFGMSISHAQLAKYLDYDKRLRNLLLDKPEISSIEVSTAMDLVQEDKVYSVFMVEEEDKDTLSTVLKTLKDFAGEKGFVQMELTEKKVELVIQGNERVLEAGITLNTGSEEPEGPYFDIIQTPPFGSLVIDNPIPHDTGWPIVMKNSDKMKAYIEENKAFLVNLIKESKARCYYLCL